MKLSGLQILLTLAATAVGALGSDVVDLTSATFADHVNSHKLVLAEFFAPWCGHCKNLAPEYEEAATALKGEDISLAKIDCVDNQETCTEHGVRGFPTLYIFENGKMTGQYQGPRKAADIERFMIRRALPVVSDVKDVKGVDAFLAKTKTDEQPVYLFAGSKKDYETFEELAKTLRERAQFIAAADNKAVQKKYNNAAVVAFRNGEAVAELPASADFTKEAVTDFVRHNEFAPFGELGPDTFTNYMANGLPLLYAFVDKVEDRDLFKKTLEPLLPTLNGKLNVVFLNATLFGMHAENINLEQHFPAAAVHNLDTNKKYVHDQEGDLTAESLTTFVKNYLADKLSPKVKTDPVPESQDGPVYTLVGSEWENVVKDASKNVLVEYYAPWCGHCKKLAPTYEELGQHFAKDDSVVIAQLNHQDNEVPVEIQGYPTIIFYPAGEDSEPVHYEGGRDLDSLVAFVEKQSVAASAKAAPSTGSVAEKAKKAAGEVVNKVGEGAKKAAAGAAEAVAGEDESHKDEL